ncbi:hypothetical protein V6N11_018596, partial [Hibiscus sabdariffa]
MAGMRIIEDSVVFPPHGWVLQASTLPLTFFDIHWLGSSPMQRLFFYDFPHSCSHFIQTVLPNLKSSLSLALQHFFPLAGNLVLPPPPQMPYIRIGHGDSVRFIAKESTGDFGHLVGDHARDSEEFQALLPKLKKAQKVKPLMAVQTTVFPGAGIAL